MAVQDAAETAALRLILFVICAMLVVRCVNSYLVFIIRRDECAVFALAQISEENSLGIVYIFVREHRRASKFAGYD